MAFFRLLIGSPKLSRIPLKVCTHLGCIPQPDAGNYGGELGCSATVTRRLELAFEHSTFLLQCSGILFSGSWLQNCRSGSNGMFVQKNIRAAAHLGHRWLLLSPCHGSHYDYAGRIRQASAQSFVGNRFVQVSSFSVCCLRDRHIGEVGA